jgi:hypothetical protein
MQIFDTLAALGRDLFTLGEQLFALALGGILMIIWIVWWLWAVNWQKAWPTLASGAWMPALLLCVLAALVWSRIAPSEGNVLGVVALGNFWWQLGAVGLLACLALVCGWLQGLMNWAPAEISLDPPAVSHEAHH